MLQWKIIFSLKLINDDFNHVTDETINHFVFYFTTKANLTRKKSHFFLIFFISLRIRYKCISICTCVEVANTRSGAHKSNKCLCIQKRVYTFFDYVGCSPIYSTYTNTNHTLYANFMCSINSGYFYICSNRLRALITFF